MDVSKLAYCQVVFAFNIKIPVGIFSLSRFVTQHLATISCLFIRRMSPVLSVDVGGLKTIRDMSSNREYSFDIQWISCFTRAHRCWHNQKMEQCFSSPSSSLDVQLFFPSFWQLLTSGNFCFPRGVGGTQCRFSRTNTNNEVMICFRLEFAVEHVEKTRCETET